MSLGLKNQLRRVSNAIQPIRAKEMLTKDLRRMSSMIKMTIPVNSDFIAMRNLVIENLISSRGNTSSNTSSSNTDVDGSFHDAVDEVETMCTQFINSFFGYRQTLSDRDKAVFDSNWAFLLHIDDDDASLSSVVPDGDGSSIDAIVHIVSSEILLTHQGSAKALGQYYLPCHYHYC